MKIADQIVLVTGGARGVGAAAVRAFAREGARVIINWRASGEAANALAAEIGDRAVALQADVTDRAAVDALVAAAQGHFGAPVTTVVNNALDYSFNGDARSQMTDIGWDELAAPFSPVLRGALHTLPATPPRAAAAGREGRGRSDGMGRAVPRPGRWASSQSPDPHPFAQDRSLTLPGAQA